MLPELLWRDSAGGTVYLEEGKKNAIGPSGQAHSVQDHREHTHQVQALYMRANTLTQMQSEKSDRNMRFGRF